MMLLERESGGSKGQRNDLERAYKAKHADSADYCEITARLYDEFRSGELVRKHMQERYQVTLSLNTIYKWLALGHAARKAKLTGGG
jgi:IS30 family transposase